MEYHRWVPYLLILNYIIQTFVHGMPPFVSSHNFSVKFLHYCFLFSKQLMFQRTHAKLVLFLINCPGKYSILTKRLTLLISVSVLILHTATTTFALFVYYPSPNYYVFYYKCGGCIVHKIFVTFHQHEFFQTFCKTLFDYFLVFHLNRIGGIMVFYKIFR